VFSAAVFSAAVFSAAVFSAAVFSAAVSRPPCLGWRAFGGGLATPQVLPASVGMNGGKWGTAYFVPSNGR